MIPSIYTQEIFKHLTRIAMIGGRTNLQEIAEIVKSIDNDPSAPSTAQEWLKIDANRHGVYAYMKNITEWCRAKRHPILTSLIVSDGNSIPSRGFWQTAVSDFSIFKEPVSKDVTTVQSVLALQFQDECYEYYKGISVGSKATKDHMHKTIEAVSVKIREDGWQAVGMAFNAFFQSLAPEYTPTECAAHMFSWCERNIVFDGPYTVVGWNKETIVSLEDKFLRNATVVLDRPGQAVHSLYYALTKPMSMDTEIKFKPELFKVKSIRLIGFINEGKLHTSLEDNTNFVLTSMDCGPSPRFLLNIHSKNKYYNIASMYEPQRDVFQYRVIDNEGRHLDKAELVLAVDCVLPYE